MSTRSSSWPATAPAAAGSPSSRDCPSPAHRLGSRTGRVTSGCIADRLHVRVRTPRSWAEESSTRSRCGVGGCDMRRRVRASSGPVAPRCPAWTSRPETRLAGENSYVGNSDEYAGGVSRPGRERAGTAADRVGAGTLTKPATRPAPHHPLDTARCPCSSTCPVPSTPCDRTRAPYQLRLVWRSMWARRPGVGPSCPRA